MKFGLLSMKRLTSISIILMIPKLIASLCGMNGANNLQENTFGFWIVLLISLMVYVFGVFLFKKKNMFYIFQKPIPLSVATLFNKRYFSKQKKQLT
jgi:CorA-like Mg2+ transporter protein